MDLVDRDDGWRIPDWLWEQMAPLLPPPPPHPLGCHRPRVSDRSAMNAILLVLHTGMGVQRPEYDGHLLFVFGPPPLPGVGTGRGVL